MNGEVQKLISCIQTLILELKVMQHDADQDLVDEIIYALERIGDCHTHCVIVKFSLVSIALYDHSNSKILKKSFQRAVKDMEQLVSVA
jgi:hypothetical protein